MGWDYRGSGPDRSRPIPTNDYRPTTDLQL